MAEVSARRVVIDSISSLEISLTASFQEEFREGLYWLVRALAAQGVTLLLTIEATESFMELRISPQHPISFVADDIIVQRYIEVDGELRQVMAVLKMRRGKHSRSFWAYEVETGAGLVVRDAVRGYRGLLLGVPEWRDGSVPPP